MVVGSEMPTSAALARAARLAHDLAAHSGHSLRQWGHRDDPAASTECPGNGIESWVKRQGAASPNSTIAPTNPAPAPAPTQEDDMPTPQDLWNADIVTSPDKEPTNPTWTPASYLRETFRLLRSVRADVGALRAVVVELAKGQPLTADQITAAAKAGAQAALDEKITSADVNLNVAP